MELVSLRGCDAADCNQRQQLKHPATPLHHHPNDCYSYSHVWPVMTENDNLHAARPASSVTDRHRGFDLQQSDHVEHTYRSVDLLNVILS